MNISDFPFPFETKYHFPTRDEICRYYQAYCDHFDLASLIRFHTTVCHVEAQPNPGGNTEWLVTVQDASGKRQEPELFQAVLVASGQFHEPEWPRIKGLDGFRGTVQHAKTYRNAAELSGKRVLVVGIGNSALDISLEVARSGASSVQVAARSGTTIIPVSDYYGQPADQVLLNRFWESLPVKIRLLAFFTIVQKTNKLFQASGLQAPPKEHAHGHFSNLKEHEAYRVMLASGRISLRPGLQEVGETTATFQDGSLTEIDHIICCTGYRFSFDYLGDSIRKSAFVQRPTERVGESFNLQYMKLYRHVLHPQHPTLGFLGIVLTYGNESCVGEMQARWALSLWGGTATPPTRGDFNAHLAKVERRAEENTPKFSQFVNYVKYMDLLAGEIGCLPQYRKTQPYLSWKLFSAPVVPAQYRLDGPHAWQGAAAFIQAQPNVIGRVARIAYAQPGTPGAAHVEPLRPSL